MSFCGFFERASFFLNPLPRGLPFGAKDIFRSSLQALSRSPGLAVLLSIISTIALRIICRVDRMAFLLLDCSGSVVKFAAVWDVAHRCSAAYSLGLLEVPVFLTFGLLVCMAAWFWFGYKLSKELF
jgi:hypothetical protein